MIRPLLLTFIPLFVAVDVVAVVLVYLGIGVPLDETARRRLVLEATMTAAAIGLGFLLVGDAVLHFLGVTVGDFQVAGGVLLLVLSIYDLLHPELPLRQPGAHLGVVPLGIPMIVGPATLTTLLTLARTHGYRSEEHTSELQSPCNLVCRLLLEKKKKNITNDDQQSNHKILELSIADIVAQNVLAIVDIHDRGRQDFRYSRENSERMRAQSTTYR